MKMVNDSHLEVKKYFSGTFGTHPYEVGWADDGSTPSVFTGEGLHIVKVQPNFGNYIRLYVNIEGGKMFLNLHIVCKG